MSDSLQKHINHWARLVREQQETEENQVPQSAIGRFIDGMFGELKSMLTEDEQQDIETMKYQAFKFIDNMKTKEDLQRFLDANEEKMREFENGTQDSKVKKYLGYLWKFLKYAAKLGWFCIKNIQPIAIIACTVFVCIKFGIGPIEAIQKAIQAAMVIYDAADITLSGAKKATDIYGGVQDTMEDVGEKVGNIIGTAWGKLTS